MNMNSKFIFILFLGTVSLIRCKKNPEAPIAPETEKSAQSSTLPNFWKDPEIMEWNREDPRADFKPVESESMAQANQFNGSNYFISLNGFWKYRFFTGPDYVPADIEKSNSYSSWLDISMPGFAELKNLDKPIFKYHSLPFKNDFPNVPTDTNSVLILKRNFEIPKNWTERNIYAVFEGISTAYFLYVNGKLAGYNEDTKCMSEYRIDTFLQQGFNELTLVLIRYSDGSYFESHNQWLLTGINRNAYILGRPKTFIRDFYAVSQYQSGKGTLKVQSDIKNNSEFTRNNYSLEYRLIDDSDKSKVTNALSTITIKENSTETVASVLNIPSVKSWSDEVPSNYTLLVILKNNEDKIVEAASTKIGFTSISYNKKLLLNNKNVKIKGVACHEFHPINGNILDKVWIDNDMDVMNLHHINAIRTNHYPFDSYWYQSALKYGLWIMDECNLNLSYLHQSGKDASQDSLLSKIYLQRVKNTFEKNKNHANIFAWSLGYNAGIGPNTQAAFKYIKSRDSKRPVAMLHNNQSFGDLSLTENENTNKAKLLYCLGSSLGNGLGNIDGKWKKIKSDSRTAGGFIEDFTDQTFYMKNKAGVLFFGHGGVFGESKSDSFLCNSGLLTSNKTPRASLKNVSELFSNFTVDILNVDKGTFKIKNNFQFFESEKINYFWIIDENSEKIKEGKFDKLVLKPGQEKIVQVPIESITRKPGKEYCVIIIIEKVVTHNGMFRFLTEKIEKECLPLINPTLIVLDEKPEIKIDKNESGLLLTLEDGSILIDKISGLISSWKYKNKEYLKSSIQPMFHRAATDLDKKYNRINEITLWKNIWKHSQLQMQSINDSNKRKIIVQQKYTFNNITDLHCDISYTIMSTHDVILDISIHTSNKDLTIMPRLSWRYEMEPGFGTVQWYGRGPYETYPDRKEGLEMGLYKNTVTDMNVPYGRPQEMSNKTEVKWAEISSFTGERMLIIGAPTFDLKALPFPNESLEDKLKYGVDLKASSANHFIIGHELWEMNDFNIQDFKIGDTNLSHTKIRLKVYQSAKPKAFDYFAQRAE